MTDEQRRAYKREYMRRYRATHKTPETTRERNRVRANEWNAVNRERTRQNYRAWYKALSPERKDALRAYQAEWQRKHRTA